MIKINSKPVYLAAFLAFSVCAGSFPVLAEEPEMMIETMNKPGLPGLVQRTLVDPLRSFSDVSGPDDCNSETVYLGTREVLKEYAANDVKHREALKNYILSGRDQCNCTRAIIGKDFDLVVEDVGLTFPRLPCP